jgi:hypothetical protein
MNNYRTLEQGEQILDGDEYLDEEDGWTPRQWIEASEFLNLIEKDGIHLPHRRKVEYPEHTSPAPPKGMKWEYRGEAWTSKGQEVGYYYLDTRGKSRRVIQAQNAIAMGLDGVHYFEAVPDRWSVEHQEMRDRIATGEAIENPKESAGRKKCPMHLLPPEFLIQTANVLGHGADKYEAWNFRKTKVNLSTYQGAMMRHLTQIAKGEDLDESGFPHLAHIAASAAIVLDAAANGMLVDDRPVKHP